MKETIQIQKALLTGATGGLGEALATLLAKKNIQQILVSRNGEKLQKLQEKIIKSRVIVCDLSKDRKSVIEAIWEEKPDLIINNAGFNFYGESLYLSTEEQCAIFEVNGKAVMEISLEAAKMLLKEKKKGIILNISSIAGDVSSTPMMSVYGASKSFVTHLSKSMDYECRPYGIRILVSCPGQFSSSFSSKAAKKSLRDSVKKEIFFKSKFSPEKLAARLWWQIENKRGVDIYDERTYLLYILTKYFIPESWSSHTIFFNLKKIINFK